MWEAKISHQDINLKLQEMIVVLDMEEKHLHLHPCMSECECLLASSKINSPQLQNLNFHPICVSGNAREERQDIRKRFKKKKKKHDKGRKNAL